MFYGEPTPMLAMLAAQTNFAVSQCIDSGLTGDAKGAAKFQKYFNNSIGLRTLQAKDPDFVKNYGVFYANYESGWNNSNPDTRTRFCGHFASDISARKDLGFIRWAQAVQYFRFKLSPISEESEARRKKILAFASVAGALITTAASVSAGEDSVASAKSGDFSTSNQQMATARAFNQIGWAINGMASNSSATLIALSSVLDEKLSDGTVRIVPCPITNHFLRYAELSDSSVWSTYQIISMRCRDLTELDLKNMHSPASQLEPAA